MTASLALLRTPSSLEFGDDSEDHIRIGENAPIMTTLRHSGHNYGRALAYLAAMPGSADRQARLHDDLLRLLGEADALGLTEVAIALDHARCELDGWSHAALREKSLALRLAGASDPA